jgi:hypothetical protein
MRTWAYVAGGVGAAGFATFGVLSLVNGSSASSTSKTIATIGLATGIVGLGAGFTLLVIDSTRTSEGSAATQGGTRLVAGPTWVQLETRFR